MQFVRAVHNLVILTMPNAQHAPVRVTDNCLVPLSVHERE
jgi:hypothetical protein